MNEEKKLTGHGGAGRGQGRKPEGKEPKKELPVSVDADTREKLKNASTESKHSQAKIVEWWFRKLDIKSIPDKLD